MSINNFSVFSPAGSFNCGYKFNNCSFVSIVDKHTPDASSNHLFLALGSTATLKGSI